MVVEIQAGEGGADSKLFVHDLLSAYLRWASAKQLKTELLDSVEGRAVFQVSGPAAWDAFRNEAGKHCVQRIPPTERNGRKQTSMVSVSVLPLFENHAHKLREADLEVTFQTGSGPGGQHRNKTQSAVRARHTPTGIQVFIDGRNQHHNRRVALSILEARVNELLQSRAHASHYEQKKEHWDGGGRGNKIRTYNFLESRAVDHRTGVKTKQVREVLKGRFDLLSV